jgi:CRP-like cAMP-binding protein
MDLKPDQYLKYLKPLPLFEKVERNDIIHMAQNQIIRMVSFDPGETIISEKSFDRRFYITLKGKVSIIKDVISEDCKHCQEIKTIEGSGHFLGEVTAFTGKPRTASVKATGKTVCVMINIGLLMRQSSQLLEKIKSKFYPRLFELLCKRLEETNSQLARAKQTCDDLNKKLKASTLEKLAQKEEYQERLREKGKEIKALEEKLESLGA